MKKILAKMALFGLLSTNAWSGLNEGIDAYQKGAYEIAYMELSPLAEGGDAVAQSILGIMYQNGFGVVQDNQKAYGLLLKAAVIGDIDIANYQLGWTLLKGQPGVENSQAKGAAYIRRAAEQGLAVAQLGLGRMYSDGIVFERDYKKAEKWLRLAAEQGLPEAELDLGLAYGDGRGVIQDYKEKAKWLLSAAEKGNAEAQFFLGFDLIEGKKIAQNLEEGVEWIRVSASQGHNLAQYLLGVLYSQGKYLPENKVLAHSYLNVAAANGNADAAKERDAMESSMTVKQITEAQDLARLCIISNYKNCEQ
jgi:TPR repeat protein